MKTELYDQAGRVIGEVELADAVFGVTPRADLIHQCVVAQLAARRAGTAKVKTKGEVAGGGKKPYRQKGTGHARQGSTRSAQWRGGGVIFGPVPRDYTQRVPRKIRRAALASALSDKAQNKRLHVLKELSFTKYRTQNVVELLGDLKLLDATVLFIINEPNEFLVKSAANIPTVNVRHAGNASVYEVVAADAVVITEDAAAALARRYEE